MAARPPARSPLPADPQLLPPAALPRWPSVLSGGAAERPDPAQSSPRPAPALRRLRSVAPGRGPAATASPGRTRRCESRVRTTAPTEPRDANRTKVPGGAWHARQPGNCSTLCGRQQQPRLAPFRHWQTSRAAPRASATRDGELRAWASLRARFGAEWRRGAPAMRLGL